MDFESENVSVLMIPVSGQHNSLAQAMLLRVEFERLYDLIIMKITLEWLSDTASAAKATSTALLDMTFGEDLTEDGATLASIPVYF